MKSHAKCVACALGSGEMVTAFKAVNLWVAMAAEGCGLCTFNAYKMMIKALGLLVH